MIGSEISSARCRSSSTTSVIVESNEPAPACCERDAGMARRATARDRRADAVGAVGGVVGVAAQAGLDEHDAAAGLRQLGSIGRAGDAGDVAAVASRRRVEVGRRPPRVVAGVGGADQDALDGGIGEAGGLDPLVGAAPTRRRRTRRRSARCVPAMPPATMQPMTSTSHSAIAVFGRAAATPATRRTPRASAPSGRGGEGACRDMPPPCQRGGGVSLGRGTVARATPPAEPGVIPRSRWSRPVRAERRAA